MDRRAAAFERLFEAVHEGVYIGTIGFESTATIAANPHLKLIFGFPSETAGLRKLRRRGSISTRWCAVRVER